MSPFFRLAVAAVVVFNTFGASFALTAEDTMLQSVYKVKVYESESITGNYIFMQWWSAVLLDSNRIITNAHVVINANSNTPTGKYEICRSTPGKKDPECFTTAKLLSYDTVADLAVLELAKPVTGAKKLSFGKSNLSIGSKAIVYGYPGIGGLSITRTEWKIGGMENDTYKFDGTIDSGNSGGGAFDSSGKLIGIPYAVRSENGMIGYIIPLTTVNDFLAGKTDNVEEYTGTVPLTFTTYIKKIQPLYRDINLLQTKNIVIKDAGKAGFTLKNVNQSIDGTIFDYLFLDKNGRVSLSVSCGKEASGKKTWIELIQESYNWKDFSPGYVRSGKFIDTAQNLFLSTVVPAKATNGVKAMQASLLYKSAPTCSSEIYVTDSKKDKTLYDKALAVAKSIKFINTPKVSTNFVSAFFTANNLPESLYLGESFSQEDYLIVPAIIFSLDGQYGTHSRMELASYNDAAEYMNVDYDDNFYEGTDVSYQTFLNRYTVVGDPTIVESVIKSKNGKDIFMTVVDKSTTNPVQEKTKVLMFYPFKTDKGEYKSYRFTFEFPVKNANYVATIRSFFESVEMPGSSPFGS